MSGTAVRAQLIQYLADSLRDIPGERRSFFYLPRVLVTTQWSRWMADIPALDHGDGQQFRVTYSIFPGDEWDALSVSDRLAQLWRMWGWDCTVTAADDTDGRQVTATSGEGWELTLHARAFRRSSRLEAVSPVFAASDQQVTMPFAVTPVGELTLPQVWAVCPELIVCEPGSRTLRADRCGSTVNAPPLTSVPSRRFCSGTATSTPASTNSDSSNE